MARLVLVPSPFVGASSCAATAAALPDALTADYGVVSGPDWYAGPAARIVAQADGRPWVAVLHSGATADAAATRGWPVRRLRLHHLAMTSHAGEVAEALLALAGKVALA